MNLVDANMSGCHKVLIVDDERINRSILAELLEDNYEIILAKNGFQALERLEINPDIDLILLDIEMPEMDGYETLRHLKRNELTKEIPVIFITARDSTPDEEKGLDLGATDYISKPFSPGIVKLRIKNHLKFVRQRKMLEELAGKDSLTEINNRRTLDDFLAKEWNRHRRSNYPLSLMMVDVDFFKRFNDNYGHAKGDYVLKKVAQALEHQFVRPSDLVARYGGEEFVILLPETPSDGAESIGVETVSAIENLNIQHEYSDVSPYVTVSGGGVTVENFSRDPQTALNQADEMLYEAKRSGRNRMIWYRVRSR